jgi:hypothetical protein
MCDCVRLGREGLLKYRALRRDRLGFDNDRANPASSLDEMVKLCKSLPALIASYFSNLSKRDAFDGGTTTI